MERGEDDAEVVRLADGLGREAEGLDPGEVAVVELLAEEGDDMPVGAVLAEMEAQP